MRLIDAFGRVIGSLEGNLEQRQYTKPSILDRFHPHKAVAEELPIHPLVESVVSGAGWRAFDPSARGIVDLVEAEAPFNGGFFNEKMMGKDGMVKIGGDEGAERCGFINLDGTVLSYHNFATEISIRHRLDTQGRDRFVLLVFSPVHDKKALGWRLLRVAEEALINHQVAYGKAIAYVGLENPKESASMLLRLRTPLPVSDSFEFTRMQQPSVPPSLAA